MTRSFAAAAAFITIGSLASTALGQEDASATAAARTIGTEGLRLAESGNCKDAIDKLDRAEKLHHAPTTLQKLGECQLQAGKIVLGLEALRRVARETLPADAPPVFQAAKQRAQVLLDQNAGKVAQLHVTVTLPAGVTPVVTVDGEAVPAALVDVDRPTDPGSHVIEATAQGYRKATQTVTLKEGERSAVTLAPDAEPNAPAPVAQTTVATTTEAAKPASPASTKTTRTVAYALYGAGAAGLLVGTIFGAVALGKKGGLNDDCPEQPDGSRLCNANRSPDDRTSLKTFATVSTVGFVVGGAGLVGGTIALLFSRSAAKGGSVVGGLQIGPTSVGYRGSF